MTSKTYPQQPAKPVREPGPIGKILNLIGQAISVMLFSILFSITIEWIGMNYWWEEPGHLHAENLLNKEFEYLNQDFKESFISSSPVKFVESTAGAASKVLLTDSGLTSFLVSLKNYQLEDSIMGSISRTYIGVESYVLAALIIMQVFFVRMSVMTLSLPLFVLAGFLGVSEGLMQRDLRRWGGGRESGFIYHHAKRLAIPAFLTAWVVYLSLPFSLHPNIIIIPFATLFGFIIYIGVSRFKKYL